MNRSVYFNDLTLSGDAAVDLSAVDAFMHEVWPRFWNVRPKPYGMWVSHSAKAYLYGLLNQAGCRHAQTMKAIIVSPAFSRLKEPIQDERDVEPALVDRFLLSRFQVTDKTGQRIGCSIMGWAFLRGTPTFGLASGEGRLSGLHHTLYELRPGDTSEESHGVLCVSTAEDFNDPAVERWLFCLNELSLSLPRSVDFEYDKHFDHLYDDSATGDWRMEDWVERTRYDGHPAQFKPRFGPNDGAFRQMMRDALSDAFCHGKFETADLRPYVYDTRSEIGAASGNPTTCIEFYVANTPQAPLHVRPK